MKENTLTHRGSVLIRANQLTHGDRNDAYGDPVENMRNTAAIVASSTGVELTPHQMAMAMVALKLARIQVSPTSLDHYVDAAAYLAMAYECVAREKAEESNAS